MPSILQMSLSIPTPPRNLSFSKTLSSPTPLFLHSKLSHLSLSGPKSTVIRMGGGPRTYPGGVSKWQWKRMQAKKAKQLLKARLARERQIYEMRKRAELKAAVTELERPWEVVERAPTLFSVGADEQLKVLADRFQKPGGFDMWSEKDGPQLFETDDGFPSARFFPKGVVHSVKPYGRVSQEVGSDFGGESNTEEVAVQRNGRSFGKKSRKRIASNSEGQSNNRDSSSRRDGSDVESSINRRIGMTNNAKLKKPGDRNSFGSANSGAVKLDSGPVGYSAKHRGKNMLRRESNSKFNGNRSIQRLRDSRSEIYDMSLQQDGSYKFQE